MRSIVYKYDAGTYSSPKQLGMNKIGSIDDQQCSRLTLDAVAGEYLSSLTMGYYPGSNTIEYIRAVSSEGQTVQGGSIKPGMTEQVMRSEEPHQIIAFWGYESDRIAAIAAVNSNSTCVKGVTSVEVSDEVPVIDIIDTEDEIAGIKTTVEADSQPTKNQIIAYSAGGAFGAVLAAGLIFSIVYLWRTRCRSPDSITLPQEVFSAPVATIDYMKSKNHVQHYGTETHEKEKLSNLGKSDEEAQDIEER